MTQTEVTEKNILLSAWRREFATTVRILQAFPPSQDDFRPAEKCRTARELAWTFVLVEHASIMAAAGNLDLSLFLGDHPGKRFSDFLLPMPQAPSGPLGVIIGAYQHIHQEAVAQIQSLTEDDFNRTIDFPVGPKETGQRRLAEVLWTMLSDMIHHRGQFSVYLRMVGANVPSIYGPTADEPWA